MKRRSFLLTAGAGAAILAGRAAAATRVVGWISPEAPELVAPMLAAFRAGLAANLPHGAEPVAILERHATGGPESFARVVAELQALGVRLILAQGAASVPVVRAAPSVPVVFAYSGDPVMAGIAQSLARPGGNATGMTFLGFELMPKRIDLIRALLPACRRIALLSNALHPGEEMEIAACRRAVAVHEIELAVTRVQSDAELATAIAGALDGGAQAVLVLPSASMVRQAPLLAGVCISRRVPLISGWASMAQAGALLTYGPNFADSYRRIANHVVRILDGAAAGSLPIERPATFELVINRRTAQAIALSIPPALLALADQEIE